jgi:carboxymethylenebutenolidase
MKTELLNLKTPDGVCDTFAAYPDDGKAYPAVLFLMDGFGVRPYLHQMAEKLASAGYYVLLPNLLYRLRPAPVFPLQFPLSKEDIPNAVPLLMGALKAYDHEAGLRDIGAFLDFLGGNEAVKQGKVGLTGYCFGGGMALRAAARFPNRVGAVASFHGGNLATEAPNSPHLLASRIRARVYVAHADNDSSMPPEQQERLSQAFREAGLRHEIELYPGAAHGFAMADLPAYNEGALQRHWEKLLALFADELGA